MNKRYAKRGISAVRHRARGLFALAGVVVGLHASPASAQLSCSTVYANNTNGAIYATANDGTQTLVATVPGVAAGSVNPMGIGAGGTRVYLGTYDPLSSGTPGSAGQVITYDPVSNSVLSTSAAPVLQPGMATFNGGAVNLATGWFYMAAADVPNSSATSIHLYAYNPATPASAPVRVAQITGTAGNSGDIAFDGVGNLYVLVGNASLPAPNARIYRVGQVPTAGLVSLPATAIAGIVTGPTSNVGGIAFNNSGEMVTSQSQPNITFFDPLTGQQRRSTTSGVIATNDMASCNGGNSFRLQKNLPDGRVVGTDQFTLQVSDTGGTTTQTATTAGSSTGVQAQAVGPLLAMDGDTVSINEVASGGTTLSNYARRWECVNTLNGNAVVGSGTSFPGSVTIPVTSGATATNVVCTITNARMATLRLQKSLPHGRAVAGNQFTLAIAGPGAPASVTTTGTGTTATGMVTHATATLGSVYTLSETAAGSPATVLSAYRTTYSCSNALSGGQTPSGSTTSFSITPAAGDDLTCTFFNRWPQTDVSVQKTASPTTVVSGQNTVFTLTVNNTGTEAANSTRLHDPAVTGLNCIALSCSATAGASCPGSPTVAGLQTAPGLTIPTLAGGSSVSFQLTCAVTATGFP